MKRTAFPVFVILMIFLFAWGNRLHAQDRFELRAPNGLSFSEIRGYETWQVIAPSYRTDKNELRIILGNAIMIKAYKEGVPGNGRSFPEGSVIVKIGWSERKSAAFPAAIEPDALQRVEFIKKDSKGFPDTNGWGYARFVFDAKTGAFSPFGTDASFAKECHQCHTLVKAKDFIFTGYPPR